MREQEWTQQTNMELKREHWERCKIDNQNMILQSNMNIEMASKVLELCEEKLKEFPEEKLIE